MGCITDFYGFVPIISKSPTKGVNAQFYLYAGVPERSKGLGLGPSGEGLRGFEPLPPQPNLFVKG